MVIREIIFFNHYRNGDCFLSKGYIKDIMKKIPNIKYSYAHNNHPNIIIDLGCRPLRISDLPGNIIKENVRSYYDQENQTLYINTWVAPWKREFFGSNEHANFAILHNIWIMYYMLLTLSLTPDHIEYLPSVDFTKFDLSQADQYLSNVQSKNLILFCNGIPQSTQSSAGNFSKVLENLSNKFPQWEFIATCKTTAVNHNITYTDNIFGSSTGNLNQISYLSHHSNIIVGKNSGPFTYSHTKENLCDPNKIFYCFSHKEQDTLTGNGNYKAKTLFSNSIDDAEIEHLIEQQIKGY